MTSYEQVWIFSEKPSLVAELLAGALQLVDPSGGQVGAFILGSRAQAQEAIAAGASQVIWLGELGSDHLVDDYVPTLVAALEEQHCDLLLVGSTKRGRAIAGRLAAQFGVTALTDVLEFQPLDNALRIRHLIFGGGAVRMEKVSGKLVIATVGAGTFTPLPTDANRQGEVMEASFVQPPWQVKLVERKPRAVSRVNLAAARRVVCLGRGIARKEDLPLVEDLTQALNAEIACTRPLAEGLDWLPRERYIGISGAQVRPDLYLGVGVSGQVQHTIGMNRSRLVVAINKDEHAPIFAQADYGIVGDLYSVVPALTQALRSRR